MAASGISETARKNQRYIVLLSRITKSLPLAEQIYSTYASSLSASDSSENAIHPRERLKALDDVVAAMSESWQDVADFATCGGELVAILEILDCHSTPKAQEIRRSIIAAKQRLKKIADAIDVRRSELTAETEHWKMAEDEIEQSECWLARTEERVRDFSQEKEKVDQELVAKLIATEKEFYSEAYEQQRKITDLVETCKRLGVPEKLYSTLCERCDSIVAASVDNLQQLENAERVLAETREGIDGLKMWIKETRQLLNCKETMLDSSRSHVENLYRQWRMKQNDLDSISSSICQLKSDGYVGSSGGSTPCGLMEEFSELAVQWKHASEQFTAFVSSCATAELNEPVTAVDCETEPSEDTIHLMSSVNIDIEELQSQLINQKLRCKELEAKRRAIERCHEILSFRLVLDQLSSSDITSQLADARDHLEIVCLHDDKRLLELCEAVPLVSHIHRRQAQVETWLSDVRLEVELLSEVTTADDTERVKVQRQSVAALDRLVADYEPLIADLMATADEFTAAGSHDSKNVVKQSVEDIIGKFVAVKQIVERHQTALDELPCNSVDDAEDRLMHLSTAVQRLHAKVTYADPIMADSVTLRAQIAENDDVMSRLSHVVCAANAIESALGKLDRSSGADYEDGRTDLQLKLKQILTSANSADVVAHQRATRLKLALVSALRAESSLLTTRETLKTVRGRLHQTDVTVTSTDVTELRNRLNELHSIEEGELAAAKVSMDRFSREVVDAGSGLSLPEGITDVELLPRGRQTALENLYDETADLLRQKCAELETKLEALENYESSFQTIGGWMIEAENRLKRFAPIADGVRAVRIQLEELKVFHVQLRSWYLDIISWNQVVSCLKNIELPADDRRTLVTRDKEITDRWSKLNAKTQQRETDLRTAYVELGELDSTIDDVVGAVQQAEDDLTEFHRVFGDALDIERQVKQLEALIGELTNQKSVVELLSDAVRSIVQRSGDSNSALNRKLSETMSLLTDVECSARSKHKELIGWLKQVKDYVETVNELNRWLTVWRQRLRLRSAMPFGAMIDTARNQLDQAMIIFSDLDDKLCEVNKAINNGEAMLSRCRQGDANHLKDTLDRLRQFAQDTREKADRAKARLEGHVRNVELFHELLQVQIDWMSEAESRLTLFRRPSRLVSRLQQQINSQQALQDDIDTHREPMKHVDLTGTYLKYRGSRSDITQLGELLMAVRLRWKRLIQRCMETGQQLAHSQLQAKRFADAWMSLCDWLDDAERRLQYHAVCSVSTSNNSDEMQRLERELTTRLPVYCSTRRAGTSLREHCTKTGESGEERRAITEMLAVLARKWNSVRSLVGTSRSQELSRLVSSGRSADAVDVLLRWLDHAKTYLAADQPVLGDLETVQRLIDQHQEFQKEAISRKKLVEKILESMPADEKIRRLADAWEAVYKLETSRWKKLHQALRLADDFNDSIDSVLEWLPLAEEELSFRSVPDNKDEILRFMENHDKFDEELRSQSMFIDKMINVSHEILASCHCDARRAVGYHVRAITARWQQVLERSSSRSQQLRSALDRIHCNSALVDSLSAWLAEIQSELQEAERQSVASMDLAAVQTLVRQHAAVHQQIESRRADIDRLRRQQPTSAAAGVSAGPTALSRLRDKWQAVWQLSSDRSKRLRELLREATHNIKNAKIRQFGNNLDKSTGEKPNNNNNNNSRPTTIGTKPSISRPLTSPRPVRRTLPSPIPLTSPTQLTSPNHNSRRSPTITSTVANSRSSAGRNRITSSGRKSAPNIPEDGDSGAVSRSSSSTSLGSTHQCSSPRHSHPNRPEKQHVNSSSGSIIPPQKSSQKANGSSGSSDTVRSPRRSLCCSPTANEAMTHGNSSSPVKSVRKISSSSCSSDVGQQNGCRSSLTCRHGNRASRKFSRESSPDRFGSDADVIDSVDHTGNTSSEFTHLASQDSVVRQCSCRVGRPVADSEQIELEIRAELARCVCSGGFAFSRVEDDKYKFGAGSRSRVCLVRFVNSTVTVRVGGGWMQLTEFLDANDPCRVRHRAKPPSTEPTSKTSNGSIDSFPASSSHSQTSVLVSPRTPRRIITKPTSALTSPLSPLGGPRYIDVGETGGGGGTRFVGGGDIGFGSNVPRFGGGGIVDVGFSGRRLVGNTRRSCSPDPLKMFDHIS